MSGLPRAPTFPSDPALMNDAITQVDDDDVTSTTPSETFHTPAAPAGYSRLTSTSTPARPTPSSKSKLRAILTWKDPKISGGVLLICAIFYYFTLWRGISVLSVCGAGFAMYLALGLVVVNANKLVFGGALDKYIKRPVSATPMFSTASAYAFADIFVEEGNELAQDVRDVIYCDNTPLSVAYSVLALVMYFAGKFFSLLSVAAFCTVLAFTVPLFYEKNKKEVDDAVSKASDLASKHLESGRKVAVERSYQLKDIAAERSAPYLEKAPVVKNFANKVGFTPTKKAQ